MSDQPAADPAADPPTDPATDSAADRLPCRVTVCRDCCCGTAKIVGVDHAAQIARLREQDVPVRISECLGVCEQANVLVVQPSADGRAAGGRPSWFGLVNDQDADADVAAWVRAGGPGLAPMPDILSLYRIDPPRPARKTGVVSVSQKALRAGREVLTAVAELWPRS